MIRATRLFRSFNIFSNMEKLTLVESIALLPEEEKIFMILKEAAAAADKPVVMRVAGGWVRDKVKLPYTSSLESFVVTLMLLLIP